MSNTHFRRRKQALTVWHEVEDALEQIIDDYERVNHLISMYQDDRARIKALQKIRHHNGTALELGSGPGNFTRMIMPFHTGPFLCLDYSDKMLTRARTANKGLELNYIRGVFEALPIRDNSVSFSAAAFALRDSLDKPLAFSEVGRVTARGGRFLLIDIGKPDNRIIRGFMSVFMKYVMPIMAGLVTSYGIRNPWNILYKTFELLPSNHDLLELIRRLFQIMDYDETLLGGMITVIGEKK